MQPKMSCFIGGGSCNCQLSFRVDHSVLCQMEGVGHVFSNHRIFKCSTPTPILFDQSLNEVERARATERSRQIQPPNTMLDPFNNQSTSKSSIT